MKRKKVQRTSVPGVTVNPALNKYDQVVLFPKKMELANQLLATMDPEFFKK